jgi:hypothetical protein
MTAQENFSEGADLSGWPAFLAPLRKTRITEPASIPLALYQGAA